MSRKFSLEWYAEQVNEVIAASKNTEEANRSALALLKDNRLKRIDEKLRTELLRAEEAHRKAPKNRAIFATYKAALAAFINSPRSPLIYFLKELSLETKYAFSFECEEIRIWLKEELRALDKKTKLDAETRSRILAFIKKNGDLPFPIRGLPIRFSPDNGRIRMDLPVQPTSNLREAFKKKALYEYLVSWRERLSAAEPPEPTRKQLVMKELWHESIAGGGHKSYEDICDELNSSLRQRFEQGWKRDNGTVVFLMEIGGFSEAEAETLCKKILSDIQSGERPDYQVFDREKIKYRLKAYGRS